MRTIHLSVEESLPAGSIAPSAAAVGFFDGIHKGHQKVIQTARQKAEELGVSSAVMTFDPHPSVVLNHKVKHASYITPLEDKQEILSEMGVDILYVIRFNKKLASLSPQEFVEQFFIQLNIQHVAAGFDFSFGFKGQGSMDTLPELAQGRFTTSTVSRVEEEEEKVSSTRIRSFLDNGEMEEVRRLLGRPFVVSGQINDPKRSDRLTVQLKRPYYLPKSGLYAVRLKAGRESYEGAAIIYNNSAVEIYSIESYNLEDEDTVSIEFYGYIREIKKNGNFPDSVQKSIPSKQEVRQFLQ
ncbi:adenylyltransferase/cytidyltransferase family protein [Halobacillus sp. Marseille-Q1614]|uniref:adenylyltransferase/cytidyltransferase family protein n=1 Tax=Halobacillus sp. Marseille-Q1614 TaxID=2709134 RepID=UPI00157123B0|nr:adenylyltransferase/cytidyltransferase family protein [Halobacillus sp. Marseille-Q1614]